MVDSGTVLTFCINRITDSNCPIYFKDAVKMLLVKKKKINLHYIKEFDILKRILCFNKV